MSRKFFAFGWVLSAGLGLAVMTGCGSGDTTVAQATPTPAPGAAASAPANLPAPTAPPESGAPGSSAGDSSGSSAGMSGSSAGDSSGSSAGMSGGTPMDSSGAGEGMVNSGGAPGMSGGPAPSGMNSGGGPAPSGMNSGGGPAPSGMNSGGGPAPSGMNSGGAPGMSGGPGISGAPGMSGAGTNTGLPSTGTSMTNLTNNAAAMANMSGSSSGGAGSADVGLGEAPGMSGAGVPGVSGFPGAGLPGGLPGGIPGASAAVPSGPEKPAEDAAYLDKAKYAFAVGREPDAYKFLIAHMLTSDEDAAVYLDEVKWVKDLANPASGVLFAVGLDLKAPSGISDYKPVGSEQANQGGGGFGGGSDMPMAGGPGMASGGVGGGGAPKKDDPALFEKATGEFGRALVRMFEERFREGKFGTTFVDVENAAGSIDNPLVDPGQAMAAGGGMGGGASSGAGPTPGMLGGGGMVPGMLGGAGGAGGARAAKKVPSIGSRMTPGLSYIGTGSAGELKSRATKDGFECLFVFDVQVEQNKRTGKTINDARVQLINLKTGKSVATSKRLNNIEVQKKKEEGESDGIEAALQGTFSKIDELMILSDLPALKPENVQKRISDLANSKTIPTLRALGEVRLFHHLKLINDDEKTAAYELLLEGADGTTLSSGELEDRRKIMDKMLPKQ
ncbi:MAG: hypothetical protein RLY14_1551 [Planctomycetota bacterium]